VTSTASLSIAFTLPQSDVLPTDVPSPLQGRGAVESITAGWAAELARRGHDVAVVALGRFPSSVVIERHGYRIALLRDVADILTVTGRTPDVVVSNSRPHHLQLLPPGPAKVLMMHNPPAPFPDNATSTSESWPPTGDWDALGTTLERRGGFIDTLADLRRTECICACSRWLAERISGMTGRRARVVYPHVDPAFRQVERQGQRRRPTILYSGRLVWRKGLADLVAMATSGGLPGELLVTDFSNTGQLAPDVLAVRNLLASTPGIRSVPPARTPEAMARLMASADVLVVPSTEEPFGLVSAEALASGTPVVGYASGGLHETGDDGLYLVETGNLLQLREAIDKAVAAGPLSVASRDAVAERFSVSASTDSLLGMVS